MPFVQQGLECDQQVKVNPGYIHLPNNSYNNYPLEECCCLRYTFVMFMPVILLLAILLPGKGMSDVTTGETPTLHVLNLWLAAFNTGDQGKLQAFWQKYSSDQPEEHIPKDQNLLSITGGLTLVKVTKDDGTHLEALMKEGHGGYSATIIEFAPGDPPLIKKIFGHPVPPPSAQAEPAANDNQLAAVVRSEADASAAQEKFSGAILIAHHGKIVLDQAWGLANREHNIKNTVDTQFCLGSVNKMFTSIAILQLVQQGKLSLDETLSTYWPDYPNHDLASRVTIRQLLTHTGGTGDIFTPEYEAKRLQIRTLADYVAFYGNRPLLFEPGSKSEYSNYGFILLGRLIEKVTGESYYEYVQKHIFVPAGMTHTDSRPETEVSSGRATGYTKEAGQLVSNRSMLPWSGTSAGGGYSTVGDLLLFADALQSGKLLDPKLLKEATSDQSGKGYGFGFYTFADGGFGHGGGERGINAEFHIFPKNGYVTIALSNRDPFTATSMVRFIDATLPHS
jgi:D-alanyl-D-alanine carboxypeptidase